MFNFVKKNDIATTIISLVVFSVLFVLSSLIFTNNDHLRYTSVNNQLNVSPVIVIDPGHGGEDGGAVSDSGIVEKNINLTISEYINDFCRLSGVDSVMTRNDDYMLVPQFAGSSNKKRADLIARTEIAFQYEDAIFVSIHQNKFENGKYKGLQVFYSKNNPESALLANIIKTTNIKLLDSDNKRETKVGGREIYVLDNIESPAVLIECGFLSNFDDAAKLNTPTYQKKLAFVIYASLMKYIYECNETD